MTLSLRDFGYTIKEVDNDNLIISFIKNILNDISPSVTSQFLIQNNINEELINKIKKELTLDFMSKKQKFINIDLINIDNFIIDNLSKVKKIEINFGLYKSNDNRLFGNGELVNHYIDLINNLLLSSEEVKNLFQTFFDNCLKGNLEKINIFNTLQELEKYNQVIFEEFNLIIQKLVKNINVEINYKLPKYLQDINNFNQLQLVIINLKKLFNFYFPKKKYNEILRSVVIKQLKQVDLVLTHSIKINSLHGLSFLEIYQKKIITNLKLAYTANNDYLTYLFNNIISNYFNFITFNPKLNIEQLINMYHEEKVNQKYKFFIPHIINILEKMSKNHKFHLKINSYFLKNLQNKNITGTISDWLIRMKNIEFFIISLQTYISLNIWKISEIEVNNLLEFFKKIKSNSIDKVVTMLTNLNQSYNFSRELETFNQQIYIFSPGVWDYVFQDESFNSNDIAPDHPFLNELTVLNNKVFHENSKLNLYLLKGSIKLLYQENNKSLTITCLPAQAFVLKYLEDNSYCLNDLKNSILKNIDQKNFDHLIKTLKDSKLIYLENNNVYLMKELPCVGDINIADKFFIITNLEENIEKEIEKQYALTIKERSSALIKHYLKIKSTSKNEVYLKLVDTYQINTKEFNDIIDYMVKMEYIECVDNNLFNLL